MQRNFFSAGLISAALIVSIIAWMAILLPSHAAPVMGSVAKSDVVISMSSNTARKGDRLDVKVDRSPNSMLPTPVGKTGSKIPVGCDGAFSKLVRSASIAVRCVT